MVAGVAVEGQPSAGQGLEEGEHLYQDVPRVCPLLWKTNGLARSCVFVCLPSVPYGPGSL